MTLTNLRDFIRPLVVASMVFVLLAGAVAGGVLEAAFPGIGVRFTVGVAGWFRAIPDPYYQLIGAAFVAYTASRGIEKVRARPTITPGDE